MTKMMTLHCAAGHDWERPAQRGRPPKTCPEHATTVSADPAKPRTPAKPKEPAQPVELFCINGNHKWLREPTKGKRPKNCPEHANMTRPLEVVDQAAALDAASEQQQRWLDTYLENKRWMRESTRLMVLFQEGDITAEERAERRPALPTFGPLTTGQYNAIKHLIPENV